MAEILRYTLYHVTSLAAAKNIVANGFRPGTTVQLANAPWKIKPTPGDTAIRIVIDLDYDPEFLSGKPGDPHLYQIHLSPETLRNCVRMEIIDDEERDALREQYGVLGDPSSG